MPFTSRIRALMTGAGTAGISKTAEKIQKDKRYKKVTGINDYEFKEKDSGENQ